MFTRPRCRAWMPLLTQQLRLRNVIKITGENIECSRSVKSNYHCRIYYTIHHSLNDKPIYTSELITLLANGKANWSEIDYVLINRTPCRSICVKVWLKATSEISESNVEHMQTADDKLEQKDEILFVWGVHFSGLILISRPSEYKFKPNTLIFQIHGSYFTSPSKIRPQIDKKVDSSEVQEVDENASASYNENRSHANTTNILGNRNKIKSNSIRCSDNEETCDIRNSSENLTNVMLSNIKSSKFKSSTHNYETAVENADRHMTNQLEPTQPNTNDHKLSLNIRFFTMKYRIKEIRVSYDLEKLMNLQKQQRTSKLCFKDIKEIGEHICMRSAFCISRQLLENIKPGAIYHNYNKSKNSNTMGRTLNRLLFQEAEIKPEDVLKSQGIKKQIENVRFRLGLLKEEILRHTNNKRKLENKLSELSDRNVEMGSWLMSSYRNLSKDNEFMSMENADVLSKKETLIKTQTILRQVRAKFCGELKDIFQIEKKTSNKYTICKIYLPKSDELSDAGHSHDSIFSVVPTSLSSALGYVAHVVQMCSIVLNIPLRNQIKFEGSRSKIIDNTKEIPNVSNEYPLYSRTYPPPKPVLYAIFLLNQNIGQLNFCCNSIDQFDPRSTLENVLQLLNGPKMIGNVLLQLPNSEAGVSENTLSSQHSLQSKSSSDLHAIPIQTGMSSKPIDVPDYMLSNSAASLVNEQRISRSVGSYSDDNLSVAGEKVFHNSEPTLATHTIAVHLENNANNENF